jgi:hypothetical protein
VRCDRARNHLTIAEGLIQVNFQLCCQATLCLKFLKRDVLDMFTVVDYSGEDENS